MQVHVITDNHIHGGETLVRDVEASVGTALKRFLPQLQRVEAHLADENGEKRGDSDKSCTLEARLAGLQPLAATGNGATLDQAVAEAIDKLVAVLDHKLGKLGKKKGRPSFGGEAEAE